MTRKDSSFTERSTTATDAVSGCVRGGSAAAADCLWGTAACSTATPPPSPG